MIRKRHHVDILHDNPDDNYTIHNRSWKVAEPEMFVNHKDLHNIALQNGWKPRNYIDWADDPQGNFDTETNNFVEYGNTDTASIYRKLIDRANNNNAVSMGNSNVKAAAPTVSQGETVSNTENISVPQEDLF